MMLPKPFNKNQPSGATGAVAKKKGLSFSPLMVVALAAFIHLFIGLSLVVSVILAVIISIVMVIRNAMKQQSSLPPLPPNENSEIEFEPLAGTPSHRDRGHGQGGHAQPIQTNQRPDERLPDLNSSHDWGRDTSEPIETQQTDLPPKYEQKPIERLSQSLPKRNTTRPRLVLQTLTPTHSRKPIDIPNLQNVQALHQAIITMAILGPCKANEKASS